MDNKLLGNWGEKLAQKVLKKKGYKLLECNYTCPIGELDIIANHNGYLVFIEVKTRSNTQFGEPFEAVSYSKRHKMEQLASYYMNINNLNDKKARFDVVSILGDKVNVIEDAWHIGD